MKYEDMKIEGIDKDALKALEQIAMDHDYVLKQRGGIEARMNDEEDFFETSVMGIQAMLEQAYLLGKRDAAK